MSGYIASAFLVIWEILCCKLLLESFSVKRQYRHRGMAAVIFLLLLVTNYMAAWLLYDHIWLKQMAMVVVMSIGMHYFFCDRYIKMMVLTMLYQGLVLLVDYTTLLVIQEIFPHMNTIAQVSPSASILFSIICKIMLLCMILVIKRRIGQKQGDMLTDIEWVRLLLLPIITISCLSVIILKFNILQDVVQDNVLVYIGLGMAGSNILVFYLVGDIMEREAIIRQEKIFHEKVKNETAMYYSISENLEKQRKKTHEFKNQIACIASLAVNEKYNELLTYVGKIDRELKVNMDMVDTNNVIVNAVVNTKYREALDKKIVFVLKVNDLSGLSLPDGDIVIILSNLLNNAIEACMKCEKKLIRFKFVLENDQSIICVSNTAASPPVRQNNGFVTGKMNENGEHGFGVGNVIDTIERNKGRYLIDYVDNMFSFTIEIPN